MRAQGVAFFCADSRCNPSLVSGQLDTQALTGTGTRRGSLPESAIFDTHVHDFFAAANPPGMLWKYLLGSSLPFPCIDCSCALVKIVPSILYELYNAHLSNHQNLIIRRRGRFISEGVEVLPLIASLDETELLRTLITTTTGTRRWSY